MMVKKKIFLLLFVLNSFLGYEVLAQEVIRVKPKEIDLSQANVGWRADCLGDLGFRGEDLNHMHYLYTQAIITFTILLPAYVARNTIFL